MKRLTLTLAVVGLLAGAFATPALAHLGEDGDALDPARNVALPCEALSTPGLVPRSARNIAHLANICGFVGTDIEFQSRMAADGLHDYAFLGTMGAGTRIFDITNPARPVQVGGYVDPGWQNDVHVRGDLLVVAFDWLVVGPHVSMCLKEKNLGQSVQRGGFDVVRLHYDTSTGNFRTETIGCFLSELASGGTHTITIHPSGKWISSNSSFDGIEVVDATIVEKVRHIPRAIVDQAHDVSFSADGNTLYSAGVSSTRIVDVSDIFNRAPTLIGTVPNDPSAAQGADGQTIDISHQSDTTADGRILAVTDEAGGGLGETRCNESSGGNIGGMHFWALSQLTGVPASSGASPATPRKIGTWIYPNPTLAIDPLQPVLQTLGRTERGCTIHVFRNGGNGSAGPGPITPGFDGVSRLPVGEAVSAHYGAGVWHVRLDAPPSSSDGTVEDSRTSWGDTLGWNVMPAADTWSAKEYKGYIYAGDMNRGFDVYSLTSCDGLECIVKPINTPGRVGGGGKLEKDFATFAIVNGTAPGGEAQFGLDVVQVLGGATPSGSLTFQDKAYGKKVQSTSIDSLTVTGKRATITGRATVDGTAGVAFTVDVEDLGKAGADTFRIVLADGYAAAGVLAKGNITVESGGLLGGLAMPASAAYLGWLPLLGALTGSALLGGRRRLGVSC
jgi:hypothetical protein